MLELAIAIIFAAMNAAFVYLAVYLDPVYGKVLIGFDAWFFVVLSYLSIKAMSDT